jgi:hypothetical protein
VLAAVPCRQLADIHAQGYSDGHSVSIAPHPPHCESLVQMPLGNLYGYQKDNLKDKRIERLQVYKKKQVARVTRQSNLPLRRHPPVKPTASGPYLPPIPTISPVIFLWKTIPRQLNLPRFLPSATYTYHSCLWIKAWRHLYLPRPATRTYQIPA